jgi:hypothetical protein
MTVTAPAKNNLSVQNGGVDYSAKLGRAWCENIL